MTGSQSDQNGGFRVLRVGELCVLFRMWIWFVKIHPTRNSVLVVDPPPPLFGYARKFVVEVSPNSPAGIAGLELTMCPLK